MKKNTVAKKIDLLFISVVLYILLYIVYYTLYKKTVFSLALAFMTLAILHLLYWGLTRGRREKKALEAKEKSRCEAVFFNLPFINAQALSAFFEGLFEKAGYRCEYFEGSLSAEKDGKRRNVFWGFSCPLTENEVFAAEHVRQKAGCAGFILLCDSMSEEGQDAVRALRLNDNIVLQRDDLYRLMKRYGSFPDTPYQKTHDKRRLREIFLYMFRRERFKSYFLLALIMFLFSFISPFKMYYLVFSGVLYLFCLFTLVFGKKRESVKSELDKI